MNFGQTTQNIAEDSSASLQDDENQNIEGGEEVEQELSEEDYESESSSDTSESSFLEDVNYYMTEAESQDDMIGPSGFFSQMQGCPGACCL